MGDRLSVVCLVPGCSDCGGNQNCGGQRGWFDMFDRCSTHWNTKSKKPTVTISPSVFIFWLYWYSHHSIPTIKIAHGILMDFAEVVGIVPLSRLTVRSGFPATSLMFSVSTEHQCISALSAAISSMPQPSIGAATSGNCHGTFHITSSDFYQILNPSATPPHIS